MDTSSSTDQTDSDQSEARRPQAKRSFTVEPMNRMANLVEPFLASGERSMLSFTAKRGPNPWIPVAIAVVAGIAAYQAAGLIPFHFFGMDLWVAVAVGLAVLTAANLLMYKHRIVVVTNKSILSLHADTLNGTPTRVLSRVERSTELGPARGIMARTKIDGERLWVPIRWRALLDVADRGRGRERTGTAADRRGDKPASIDLRPSARKEAAKASDDAKSSADPVND